MKFSGEQAHDNTEFGVSGVLIHSEWDVNDSIYQYHDIALLKLEHNIEHFTEFLRPVCLTYNYEIFDIKFGNVNAFNRTRFHNESNKRNDQNNETNTMIDKMSESYEPEGNNEISVVVIDENFEQVNKSTKLHLMILPLYEWQKAFVAENDSYNICGVEVGSGFYVEFQGKVYLRGIVSSFDRKEEFNCSEHGYAIFTDVPEYFKPVDMDSSYLFQEKNHFIDFSEAKSLVRVPVCR